MVNKMMMMMSMHVVMMSLLLAGAFANQTCGGQQCTAAEDDDSFPGLHLLQTKMLVEKESMGKEVVEKSLLSDANKAAEQARGAADKELGAADKKAAEQARGAADKELGAADKEASEPHYKGGYIYNSREAASAACDNSGMRLCTKTELKGHSMCAAGWTSDWMGYWMEGTHAGCGSDGYNAQSRETAGAYCCKATTAAPTTVAPTTTQAACPWSSHTGKYSGGYAGGVSTVFGSVQNAKSECLELGADVCKAITCNTGETSCTMRASGLTSLGLSPSGETTYVPTTTCFQAQYQVASAYASDHQCGGAWDVDRKKITSSGASPSNCAQAVSADPECSTTFYFTGSGLCRCVPVGKTCVEEDASRYSGITTIYELLEADDTNELHDAIRNSFGPGGSPMRWGAGR